MEWLWDKVSQKVIAMDVLAAIFEIAGAWLVGNKNKWGFVLFMVGNLLWFGTGLKYQLVGLLIVSVVFGLINIRNYRKWTKVDQ